MPIKSHTQKENISMKFVLILTALFLYVFSYPICELAYADDIDKWWHLKYTIFSCIVFLLVFANWTKENGVARLKQVSFVASWFVGFLVFDLIDRLFFEPVLNWNDWFGLIISGVVAWKKNK